MTAGVAVDLEGRVALVTGASRGIGAAIARHLAAANARVALHYGKSHDSARAVAASITAAGYAAPLLVPADVASEDERRRLYREVVAGLGAPSILVNNAGFYRKNAFEETDDAAWLARWRETMAVNLEAAAHLSFLALPAMREKSWGRIVMIASRSAFRAETDHPDYAVSKAGMVNLEAAAHLSFLALPAMRESSWGRIVMISSRSAFRAETDHPDYAVSKAGMV
ncbi:MAG: SDR family NAD(P)-dependent oxidoreductase, partial [Thermoanaerobaculia bacterium]